MVFQSPLLKGIRAVFFDAGGTLLYPHPSVGEVYSRVAAEHGVIAQPDQTTAETRAKKWQEEWDAYLDKKGDRSPNDPTITWKAEEWPWGAKDHTADLVEHGGEPEDHC